MPVETPCRSRLQLLRRGAVQTAPALLRHGFNPVSAASARWSIRARTTANRADSLPAAGATGDNADMWPFRRQSHLSYPSVAAWMEAERIPADFVNIPDAAERDRVIGQYGELRRHLFEKHVRTLPPDEQTRLAQNRHPSQSHERMPEARRYADALREQLREVPFVRAVGLGAYHCDRVILCVEISPEVGEDEALSRIPLLFSGFEVRIHPTAPTPQPAPPQNKG